MSQPASKEPTMDEILSSIRQIIADDDEPAARKVASAAPEKPALAAAPKAVPAATPKPAAAKPEPAPKAEAAPPKPAAEAVIDPFSDDDDDVQPLALSPEQIIADDDEAEDGPIGFDIPEAEPEAEMPSSASLEAANEIAMSTDVAFDEPEPKNDVMQAARTETEKPSSFAQAAPMPDATLSADMANELLEPATKAAVQTAFAKLDTPSRQTADMALGASGMTIENMIREMLRPMLKDWLEENLPSMVERMVEKEIERVSRG